MERLDQILGCMLGGAVGDALGAPVEFLSLPAIRARFGPEGLLDYASTGGHTAAGAITDDTQMSLFTAEGLIRAHVRGKERGICHAPSVVHHAYLRWLWTQGHRSSAVSAFEPWPDGWLVGVPELHVFRAPGATCLSALEDARRFGERAINDSKGCGTVMRVAPVGLLSSPSRAFDVGVELSRLTHGHPTGYLAGGYFAQLIALIMDGKASLEAAAVEALDALPGDATANEVRSAVQGALTLARRGEPPRPELVERLGGGWVAEEAVAIGLYCALVGRDFRESVLLAVNHSGDSDSTGALAGNLRGALEGVNAIPGQWLARLELREVIETVACDLHRIRTGAFDVRAEAARYPGS